MPKQPIGTVGKKPPAPSVKVRASRKCRLSAEQREALELLAGNPQVPMRNFANIVAAVSELFAAFLKVLPQFVRDDLCAGRRSTGRPENCQ